MLDFIMRLFGYENIRNINIKGDERFADAGN